MTTSRALVAVLVTFATFADLVAYSICFPVLPDLATRFGATPTIVGLLFGSFGVTLLAVSIPMGLISDRIGRRAPMVLGMATLAASTVFFAYARGLPWLFAARLIQGASDAVIWVVGFAVIADLYGPHERGRVMGLVMAGTSLGLLVGPPLGGWLYDLGGVELPFIVTGVMAALDGIAFALIKLPERTRPAQRDSMIAIARMPAIASTVILAAVGSATLAMAEPVTALLYRDRLGFTPTRLGMLFGLGALASTSMHPVFGWLSDRIGGRRLMLGGLALAGCFIPGLSLATGMVSALIAMALVFVATSMTVTPSLTFISAAATAAGVHSYGVVYGFYNVAWGIGLMSGPSIGGFLYERVGFGMLSAIWAAVLLPTSAALTMATRER